MKGIDVFVYLFLVYSQLEFGHIDKEYTNEIKGEFLVEMIILDTKI